MDKIRLIERVLGHEYGKLPKIVKNRPLDIASHFLKEIAIRELISFLTFIHTGHLKDAAAYHRKTHALFLPSRPSEDPESWFKTYHELGHGYACQRSNWGQLCEDLTKELIAGDIRHISYEKAERALMLRSIDEGIADYLAIEAQKLWVKEGGDPKDAYCFHREWSLVNFSPLELHQEITEPTPLALEEAQSLERYSRNLIADYFGALLQSQKERVTIRNMTKARPHEKALLLLENLSYILGHYYVRTQCELSDEKVGTTIDRIIQGPPSGLVQLQKEVMMYFK